MNTDRKTPSHSHLLITATTALKLNPGLSYIYFKNKFPKISFHCLCCCYLSYLQNCRSTIAASPSTRVILPLSSAEPACLPACLPAPVRFVTLKPAIVFKAKYRGGNARVGCLCVTQQSFAQGCSPLPYILPPNRPAWPSCLHGNASVCVCVCVCMCVCVCSEVQALPTLLSSGEAGRLLPPPSSLPSCCFIWSVSQRFVSCHSFCLRRWPSSSLFLSVPLVHLSSSSWSLSISISLPLDIHADSLT